MRRATALMMAILGAAAAACGNDGPQVDPASSTNPSSSSTSVVTSAAAIPGVPKVTIRTVRREQRSGHPYEIAVEYAELSGLPGSAAERANTRFREQAEKEADSFAQDVANNDSPCEAGPGCTATLRVTMTPTLVSAEAVSLRVSGSVYPSGAAHPTEVTGGETVDARDGHPVALSELFSAEPGRYLARLSKESRPRVLAEMEEDCRQQFEENDEGLAPEPDNFAAWRLTLEGLEIGFGNYQLAAYACGTQTIVIPWKALAPDLSATGRRLSGT